MKLTKRILELKEIIEECNPSSILDIGCRDCIVRSIYSGQYLGLDLFQNEFGSVDIISDFATFKSEKMFQMVIAFDILEHMDNPQIQFPRMLELSEKYLAISLPNNYDLLHTFRFVFKNKLSNKYIFHSEEVIDRHRWVVSMSDIEKFVKFNAKKYNLNYTFSYTHYFSDATNMVKKIIGKLIFTILPKRWTVINCVILFEKK
jgi:hypothetical protein